MSAKKSQKQKRQTKKPEKSKDAGMGKPKEQNANLFVPPYGMWSAKQ